LQDAKDMRLKLAVASSGKRSWVAGNLTRFGLLDYFQVICTSEDVEKVKPDPALFLLAAEKLGVRPQEAIVFEDSYNGLVAAKKAGTFVVIVPNPLTEHMDFSQADIKLKSLADLPLKDLLARAAHAEEPSAAD
jgi:beta-phosphoglucomutase-like phosphatase (HAD superfamily)